MVATIRIQITGDATSAQRAADRAASSYEQFGSSMEQLAVPAGVAVGAIGLLGKGAIDAASTAEQAMGGVNAVFGQSADRIHAWAAGAAQDVGLSSAAYEQMAAGVGGALTGMGVPMDQAASSTHDLMLRAADLASVFGGTTAQAADAVTSAFRGEYDSLQRLIPGMSAAAVEAQMQADAAAGMTFASEEAARAHAITTAIMDKSAAAAGNFAKEADTAAGAQQRANAEWADAQAKLGAELLPVVQAATAAFASFAQWVSENSTLVLTLGGIVGGLAAAVLAVNAAMAVASAAQAAWTAAQLIGKGVTTAMTAAQTAFNAVMLANPVMLVVAAIALLIAGIVLLWTNSEDFRNFVIGMWESIAGAATAAWEAISSAAGAAWDWITDKVSAAADLITGAWQALQDAAAAVWDWIGQKIADVWGWIVDKANAAGAVLEGIWNTIKQVAVACWEAIKSAVDALLAPFRAVRDAVQWLIDKLKQAWDWATKVLSKIPFVGDMIGASAAAAPVTAAAAVPLTGVGALRSTRSTGGGVVINVSGALDPVAVARQIEDLLRRQQRRTLGVNLT